MVDLVQLLQQIPDALVLGLGHDHLHFDDLISALAGMARRRSALFTQAQFFAAVRSRGNADLRASIDGGDFDLCAERSFRHGDGNDGKEIVAAAIEKRMGLDLHHDVEIARRGAVKSGIAPASHADA